MMTSTDPQAKTGRSWRFIRRSALVMLALLIVLGAIATWLLGSRSGQTWLLDRLVALSRGTSYELTFEGVSGNLLSDPTIAGLTIADRAGIWLEAEAVTIHWHWRDLLEGGLSIDAIQANRIFLARTPLGDPGNERQQSGPVGLPVLPFDLTISKLRVEKLEIPTLETKQRTFFTVDAGGQLSRSGTAAINLAIAPLRAGDDQINLLASFDEVAQHLQADIVFQMAANGALATLFRQRDRGVDLRLRLAGSIDALEGPLTLSVSDLGRLDALIRSTPDSLTVKGTTIVVHDLGERLRPAVDQPLHVALSLNRTNGQTRLDLSHPDWDLTTSKTIDSTDLLNLVGTKARMHVRQPLLGKLVDPVRTGDLEVDLVITGMDDELAATMSIASDYVDVPTGQLAAIKATIDAAAMGDDIRISVDGRAEARAEDPDIQALLGDQIALTGTVLTAADFSRFTSDGLSVSLATAVLNIAGEIDPASLGHELAAQIVIGDLAAFLPGWGGSAYADITSQGADLDSPWQIDGRLDIGDLAGPDDWVQMLTTDHVSGEVKLVRSADNKLVLDRATLSNTAFRVDAEGSLDPDQGADIKWRAQIPTMAVFNPALPFELAGGLNLAGALQGTAQNWQTNATTQLAEVALPNTLVTGALIHMEASGGSEGLNGALKAAASSTLGAMVADIDLSLDAERDGTIAINKLQLARLSIDGQGQIENGAFKGLSLALVSLPAATSSIDEIQGEIDGTLRLEMSDQGPVLDAILYSDKAVIPLAGGDTILIDGGGLNAQISPEEWRLSFSVLEAGSSRFAVGRLAAGILGPPSDLSFDVSLRGALDEPIDLLISGQFDRRDDQRTLVRGSMNGEIAALPQDTQKPFEWQSSEGLTRLLPFQLSLGGGAIGGQAEISQGAVTAQLNVAEAPLELGRAFASAWPYRGQFSMDVDLIQGFGAPLTGDMDLSVRLTEVADRDVANLPYDAQMRVIFQSDLTVLLADMHAGDTDLAQLQFSAPITADLSRANVRFDRQADWLGLVRVDAPMTPFWSALGLPRQQLEGQLKIQADLLGSRATPDLRGSFAIENGLFIDQETGFELDDMTLNASFTEQRLTIEGFTATDGADGSFGLRGWADIDRSENFPFALTLITEKAVLVRRPDIRTTASANLNLVRDQDSTLLSGALVVDQLDASLSEFQTAGVPNLPVTEINRPDRQSSSIARRQPVLIDLSVRAPDQLVLSGRGLDAEFAGDIKLSGEVREPRIAGGISLVRGTFEFAGTRFDLTRGNVTFDGGTRIDPILDIQARSATRDLTAFLAVEGPSSNPALTLSSDPSLPEDEVLSRLLFGSSASEITALEAVELAAALASLSRGGPDRVGSARRRLGLDRLAFSSGSEEDGPTITGGKYLSNNVYLEVITATSTGEAAARLEVDLTKNLSLLSRFGSDRENALSIQWSWNY